MFVNKLFTYPTCACCCWDVEIDSHTTDLVTLLGQ